VIIKTHLNFESSLKSRGKEAAERSNYGAKQAQGDRVPDVGVETYSFANAKLERITNLFSLLKRS